MNRYYNEFVGLIETPSNLDILSYRDIYLERYEQTIAFFSIIVHESNELTMELDDFFDNLNFIELTISDLIEFFGFKEYFNEILSGVDKNSEEYIEKVKHLQTITAEFNLKSREFLKGVFYFRDIVKQFEKFAIPVQNITDDPDNEDEDVEGDKEGDENEDENEEEQSKEKEEGDDDEDEEDDDEEVINLDFESKKKLTQLKDDIHTLVIEFIFKIQMINQGIKSGKFIRMKLYKKLKSFRRLNGVEEEGLRQVESSKLLSIAAFLIFLLFQFNLLIILNQQWFYIIQDLDQFLEDLVNQKALKNGLKFYRNYAIRNNLHKKNLSYPGGFMPKMTEYEAKLILGIEDIEQPSNKEIISSFMKQIALNHPDRNGSEFITKKIIEAKTILKK